MVSFFKTQWIKLCFFVCDISLTICDICIENYLGAVIWFFGAIFFILYAFIDYDGLLFEAKLHELEEQLVSIAEEVENLNNVSQLEDQYIEHLNTKVDQLLEIVQEQILGGKK